MCLRPNKAAAGGSGPAVSAVQPCPLLKHMPKLVELVEVNQAGIKVVQKPGPKSSTIKDTEATRTDTHHSKYKQFININREADHPEYGQTIYFKTRVRCPKCPKGTDLTGHKVRFTYKLDSGKGRPASLVDDEKEGFGPTKATQLDVETLNDGWTDVVQFCLSQYAGDKFKVYAQAIDQKRNRPSGKKLSIGTYQVWRKFWYQLTKPADLKLPSFNKAKDGWYRAKAEMTQGNELTFNSTTGWVPERTFYREWMVKGGKSERWVAVIGEHNKQDIYNKYVDTDAADRPVKAHLMICEYQFDPAIDEFKNKIPATVTTVVDKNEFQQGLDVGSNGRVLDPALEDNLLESGTYQELHKGFWGKLWDCICHPIDFWKDRRPPRNGDLTTVANSVTVKKGRKGLNYVHVKLPDGIPGKGFKVEVVLEINYAQSFAGESNGYQILIAYEGKNRQFNETIIHEIGHAFCQVPDSIDHSPSLPDHKEYCEDKHGGSGNHHCGTDRKEFDWLYQGSIEKYWSKGTCVMYHTVASCCKSKFCDVCEPYTRLQDMSSIKQPL
jgi:hypothetical protein